MRRKRQIGINTALGQPLMLAGLLFFTLQRMGQLRMRMRVKKMPNTSA